MDVIMSSPTMGHGRVGIATDISGDPETTKLYPKNTSSTPGGASDTGPACGESFGVQGGLLVPFKSHQ